MILSKCYNVLFLSLSVLHDCLSACTFVVLSLICIFSFVIVVALLLAGLVQLTKPCFRTRGQLTILLI